MLVEITFLVFAALTGCNAQRVESSNIAQTARISPVPGGVIRQGDSFAMMSEQYTPRAGPYAATGASAWVAPAPAPAFVAAGPLPLPDPPAPDPIAAAVSRVAAPGSGVERPEAAAATPDPAVRAAGLALLNTMACGTCHIFADAGASGSIGPSLDRNPRLTGEYAAEVIGSGQGAMPSFAGQMTEAEIAMLANYLVQFTRK